LKILLPVVLRTGICLRGHPVWSVWDAEIAARPKSRIAETESLKPWGGGFFQRRRIYQKGG
jgi:hypothetical protein